MRPPDDGPTVPVKVTPEDLHHVAQQFSDTGGEFKKLRENLWNGLRPAAGWAGVDEQARKWVFEVNRARVASTRSAGDVL